MVLHLADDDDDDEDDGSEEVGRIYGTLKLTVCKFKTTAC